MQLPTTQTPIAKCQQLSLYTTTMLGMFPDAPALSGLAPKLEAATRALVTAHQAFTEASVALVSARVAVQYADYLADQAVREVQNNAEIADGRPKGRIAGQLFPQGITPIIRPVGASQVSELRALEGRLEALAQLWPDALAQKAKLTDLRTRYEAAVEARRSAMQKTSDLRAARDIAREDFLDVYAETAGRIKAELPRDRRKQDLFFDQPRAASSGDADPVENASPGAAAPTGAGAPAGGS